MNYPSDCSPNNFQRSINVFPHVIHDEVSSPCSSLSHSSPEEHFSSFQRSGLWELVYDMNHDNIYPKQQSNNSLSNSSGFDVLNGVQSMMPRREDGMRHGNSNINELHGHHETGNHANMSDADVGNYLADLLIDNDHYNNAGNNVPNLLYNVIEDSSTNNSDTNEFMYNALVDTASSYDDDENDSIIYPPLDLKKELLDYPQLLAHIVDKMIHGDVNQYSSISGYTHPNCEFILTCPGARKQDRGLNIGLDFMVVLLNSFTNISSSMTKSHIIRSGNSLRFITHHRIRCCRVNGAPYNRFFGMKDKALASDFMVDKKRVTKTKIYKWRAIEQMAEDFHRNVNICVKIVAIDEYDLSYNSFMRHWTNMRLSSISMGEKRTA